MEKARQQWLKDMAKKITQNHYEIIFKRDHLQLTGCCNNNNNKCDCGLLCHKAAQTTQLPRHYEHPHEYRLEQSPTPL